MIFVILIAVLLGWPLLKEEKTRATSALRPEAGQSGSCARWRVDSFLQMTGRESHTHQTQGGKRGRSRAANFATIRARMEELRRERDRVGGCRASSPADLPLGGPEIS